MPTKFEQLLKLCDEKKYELEYRYHSDYPKHWQHLKHGLIIRYPYILGQNRPKDHESVNEKSFHMAVSKMLDKLI